MRSTGLGGAACCGLLPTIAKEEQGGKRQRTGTGPARRFSHSSRLACSAAAAFLLSARGAFHLWRSSLAFRSLGGVDNARAARRELKCSEVAGACSAPRAGGYYLGGGSGAAETLGLAPLERGSRPAARAGPPQPPGALELPPSASLAASASSTSTPAVLAPSPASPFSVPLASLVGALRHALPPAAVQDADTLGLLTGQQGLLVQQDTLVSGQAASLTCSGDDGAAGVAGGPAARSLTVPELPCSDSSKGRLLSSCTASLAALASVGTLAATNGSNGTPQGAPAPPHGVKAVCGKRTKMEDAFSVLCNFADVQMSAADTADCGYKLPARIASQVGGRAAADRGAQDVSTRRQVESRALPMPRTTSLPQVGEQLEVPTPPPAPGNPPGQPHASSPTASVPLSPNSTCVPSLSNSDQEASVGGSANSSSSSSDASDASTSTSTASTSAASACQCDTLHFFAVYDGHGGVEAAQHCANRMHYHLSVALSAVAGATVSAALHTQDTCCATNHLQAPAAADTAGGDAAAPADAPAAALVASSSAMVAASLQCEAVWTLCPSPLGDGPERSVDSIVAPPSELFPGAVPRNAGRAAGAPGARAHGADREGGDGGSQAQQALDRLFRSSEGVAQGPPAPAPAAPEAAPASRAAAAAGGAEGAAGASGADGDASSHSSGDASRSESAGTSSSSVCKSEALEEALRSAFLRTDEEFAEDGSASMVGSTAVVALVGTKKLWIANCGAPGGPGRAAWVVAWVPAPRTQEARRGLSGGRRAGAPLRAGDSRAVLCRGGRAIQVTDDHKPEREDEAVSVLRGALAQVLGWGEGLADRVRWRPARRSLR